MLARSNRTIVSCVDQTIAKLPSHFRFDSPVFVEGEYSSPDPALIRNNHEFESFGFQAPQRFNRTWKHPHVVRTGTVIRIFHNRAVAIDKDGRKQPITHLP